MKSLGSEESLSHEDIPRGTWVFVGPPASGKTSFIENFLYRKPPKLPIDKEQEREIETILEKHPSLVSYNEWNAKCMTLLCRMNRNDFRWIEPSPSSLGSIVVDPYRINLGCFCGKKSFWSSKFWHISVLSQTREQYYFCGIALEECTTFFRKWMLIGEVLLQNVYPDAAKYITSRFALASQRSPGKCVLDGMVVDLKSKRKLVKDISECDKWTIPQLKRFLKEHSVLYHHPKNVKKNMLVHRTKFYGLEKESEIKRLQSELRSFGVNV